MPGSADRRPWLILSRREGRALLDALEQMTELSPDLRTAREQLGKQLAWIAGSPVPDEPTIVRAVEREYA